MGIGVMWISLTAGQRHARDGRPKRSGAEPEQRALLERPPRPDPDGLAAVHRAVSDFLAD